MEKKALKISTPHQLERLVLLLQQQPDLATGKGRFGSSKTHMKESWDKIAVELNSMGPPKRTTPEWQRVWIHYKANLKRKLANNRNNLKITGGGPSEEKSLNPLEQTVANLVMLQKSVNPAGRAFGMPSPEPLSQFMVDEAEEQIFPFDMSENIPPPVVPETVLPPPTNLLSSHRRQKKTIRSIEEERLQAIVKQTSNQEEILKTMRKMEETIQKTYELKERKLELLIKQSAQQDEWHKINMLKERKM